MFVTLLLEYRDRGFDIKDKRYGQGDKGIKKEENGTK
jgi:hypothetical protein